MRQTVKRFQDMTPELQAMAGGKGAMLARMFQGGYPVPDGFVIFPSAFQGDELNREAWHEIQTHLNALRKNDPEALFAVRSSALQEDSVHASFAGEFETVLNVKKDEEIREAIHTVYGSRQAERVQVYSAVQGIEASHQIAVVVQRMVPSEISGVLFTADPITGSHASMTGNFVYGLGEQLVSGEANPYSFQLVRPKGTYAGPDALKPYASTLYRLAARLERELGGPQDIEWAVAKGSFYILQARPITTLKPGNPDTYEWNDTQTGDFLWTNTNIGEAIPDVMTPLTWSVLRSLDEESTVIPGYYIWSGNICGRAYTNISVALSIFPAFGLPMTFALKKMREALGQIPEGMSIPVYPFSRLHLIKEALPNVIRFKKKVAEASRHMQEHLAHTPDWCRRMTALIRNVQTKEELLSLWKDELQPYTAKAWWALLAGGRKFGDTAFRLNKVLTKLVGTEDANALFSNLRGSSGLASLGPVVGISRVIKGEISREDYLRQYGHRGPHEFELSIPHPQEDAHWLDRQIEEYKKSHTDVEGLLQKQHAQYEEAWQRFQERFPAKVTWLKKQLATASEHAHLREAARSEFVRVYRVNRTFALRAGELTGLGDDLFFLYLDEVLHLLSGDDSAVKHIPARKKTFTTYIALPPFPTIIRGRFDPFTWAENPNRRVDCYDATMPLPADESETLKGFAGAAGRIEGVVRVLNHPEEGDQLQPGEILVASTTNVGWTPLFPKAAAIITDIGAPLSHAAIVARELGIPAVVGCGNATTRLKTGDRVIVDGGQGIVQIVKDR